MRKDKWVLLKDVGMIMLDIAIIYQMIKSENRYWIFIAGFMSCVALFLITDLIVYGRFGVEDENGDFMI